jgi:hypothetical protein
MAIGTDRRAERDVHGDCATVVGSSISVLTLIEFECANAFRRSCLSAGNTRPRASRTEQFDALSGFTRRGVGVRVGVTVRGFERQVCGGRRERAGVDFGSVALSGSQPSDQLGEHGVAAVHRRLHPVDDLLLHVLVRRGGEQPGDALVEFGVVPGDGRHQHLLELAHVDAALVELSRQAAQAFGLGLIVPGAFGESAAEAHLNCLDEARDVLIVGRGRFVGLGGQAPHLARQHREAFSGVAGTRSLDGGVDGQDLGLPGNAADGIGHGRQALHLPDQLPEVRPLQWTAPTRCSAEK